MFHCSFVVAIFKHLDSSFTMLVYVLFVSDVLCMGCGFRFSLAKIYGTSVARFCVLKLCTRLIDT
jgi:hypothetical protein